MATGSPSMMTPVQMVRMVFIQTGGSLGPGGTRTKFGPVIHLAQTYSCTARTAPPATAHAWTGLNEARGCARNDSGSIPWIAVFCLNADCIVSPPSWCAPWRGERQNRLLAYR